jgi:hypothetical protein
MGMEQGGYIDGEPGGDFNLGMGAGGDSYAIDYASEYGGAQNYTGDYGNDFNYGYGAGESSNGSGDLYGAYVAYYTEAGFDLTTAMELAAQEAMEPSFKLEGEGRLPLPDSLGPETFYGLPYTPDPFLTPYTPIFPDLPAPLPPIVTPTFPFTVAPPPQMPLPQTPTTGPIPIAPGLPPACPVGQYHPYPIGHPDQNRCVPFPPAQVKTSPQAIPAGAAGGGSSASKSPVTQKPPSQQQCPQGQYRDPITGQCKPVPQGQPQACPAGYYRTSAGQCLPIPKCSTPGTVFDAAVGLCVPTAQAIAPVDEFGSIFGGLKNIPWWLWAAAAGLLLLGRDDDGPRRRAR